MFGKFSGTDIELFGRGQEPCVSLREEEVMGVIMSKEKAAQMRQLADPAISNFPA
jgi:hypothetical protein